MTEDINILIVDDDPGLRRTLADILRAKGYTPILAAGGKQALDRAEQKLPAVAIIDLRLEDMSGLEVMKEIKRRSPTTECIVVTGYASQASAIEAVNLGAYSYVQKPYDMEQLLLTIRRSIEKCKAEEALRIKDSAVESSINAIAIANFGGNLTYVNGSFLKLWGCDNTEALGKPISELWQVEEEAYRALDTLRDGGSWIGELVAKRRDGSSFEVQVLANLVTDGAGRPICIMASFSDITERKRAERTLRESVEFSSSLLNNSANPIVVINPDTSIRYANPALEKLTGFSFAELIGIKAPYPWWTEEALEQASWSFERAMLEGAEGVERLFQKKNGERFWVKITFTPVRSAERLRYCLVNWADITERKRGEEALRQAAQVAIETLLAICTMLEERDSSFAGHSQRVTAYALRIGERMGLPENILESLRLAGLLHDVGKAKIPNHVLNKPASLTPLEWQMICGHPAESAAVAAKIAVFQDAVPAIRHHHELWDGTGYPAGLKGEEIPLLSRILAVADWYEALTSPRPHRQALSKGKALEELRRNAGRKLDPKVVEVFLELVAEGLV